MIWTVEKHICKVSYVWDLGGKPMGSVPTVCYWEGSSEGGHRHTQWFQHQPTAHLGSNSSHCFLGKRWLQAWLLLLSPSCALLCLPGWLLSSRPSLPASVLGCCMRKAAWECVCSTPAVLLACKPLLPLVVVAIPAMLWIANDFQRQLGKNKHGKIWGRLVWS